MATTFLDSLHEELALASSELSAALARHGLRPNKRARLIDRLTRAADEFARTSGSPVGAPVELTASSEAHGVALLSAQDAVGAALRGTPFPERDRLIAVVRHAQWNITHAEARGV